jgi:hypothetical protein
MSNSLFVTMSGDGKKKADAIEYPSGWVDHVGLLINGLRG